MNFFSDTDNKSPMEQISRDFLLRAGTEAAAADIFLHLIRNMGNGDTCLELSDEEIGRVQKAPVLSVVPDTDGLFVLDGNLLFTRRNWRYEQHVMSRLLSMREKVSDGVRIPDDPVFASLHFCQKEAVRMMCENRFSILTGGPGTGKTYTIARAVKLALQEKNMRIGLAAPTGKAAARVNETMEKELKELDLSGIGKAVTIHSLLGPDHTGVRFKHDAANPLELDWLIIDEASMVDLPLMAKLLEALPPECCLTLVGDAHQLASVESGRVFGDLCHIPALERCELTVSSRFPAGGAVDTFARAVNTGDTEQIWIRLAQPEDVLHFRELRARESDHPWTGTDFAERIVPLWAGFAVQTTPAEALRRVDCCRILCAVRRGPCGTEMVNEYVMHLLQKQFPSCPVPVMITRNDRELEVSNGDVGVIMPDQPERLFLQGKDQEIRAIPTALLPDKETAFASTIHKAQGAEYDGVVIVLPSDPALEHYPQSCALLTRELLYTAVTRTKGEIFLYSGKAAIAHCCQTEIKRRTGLRQYMLSR